MQRVKIVCAECGSDNVSKDATAHWNVETQAWDQVAAVFDKPNFCQDCEIEVSLKEIPLDE